MTLDTLDPRSSALLVIDLQNAFIHDKGTLGISGVDTKRLSAIVPTLAELIPRCQAAGIPVIWTVQEHFAVDASRARKKLAGHTSRRKQVSALAGSWDEEIVEELKPLAAVNPAYVIPVVELSCHPGTDAAVLARTKALMEAIGKLPVVCGASPGYIVLRLQALVMNEAARMIEEGAATAEEIDKATRYGLGLRFAALGVVEFIDFGGCDILHHASREMSASIDRGRYTAPAIVDRMVEEGRLGLKSGSGFYDYQGRDIAAYRRDVLSRTLGELRHAGLWRAPADETRS